MNGMYHAAMAKARMLSVSSPMYFERVNGICFENDNLTGCTSEGIYEVKKYYSHLTSYIHVIYCHLNYYKQSLNLQFYIII